MTTRRIGRWSIYVLFIASTFPMCTPLAHAPQSGTIVASHSSALRIINNSEWPLRVYSMPANVLLGNVGAFSEECVRMPIDTQRLRADPFASKLEVSSPDIRQRALGWRWTINKIEVDLATDLVQRPPCDQS